MKEAIIYLGCSYPQIENIRQVKSANVEVIGTDKNNVDENIRSLLTEFHRISATDVASLIKLTKTLKKKFKILFAYGVADYCYKAIGEIHKIIDKKELPCDYREFYSKIESSKVFDACKLPHAKLICTGNNVETFIESWIKKKYFGESVLKIDSRNNSSGVHILKETSENNIRKALKDSHYKGEKILLEKKLNNYKRIINLDGIVKNGDFEPKVFTSRVIDKNDIRRSLFFVQPAIHLTKIQKKTLVNYAKIFLKKINFRFGAITIDFADEENGGFKVLEISPHFHIIRSSIWYLKQSPLVDLIKFRSRKKILDLITNEERNDSYIVCYHVLSEKKINKKNWEAKISDLKKKGHIVDGYSRSSTQLLGGKLCIGLLWKTTSQKKIIYNFTKTIEKILLELKK